MGPKDCIGEKNYQREARLGCCSLAAALLGQGAPGEIGPGKSSPFFSISVYLNKQLHKKKRPGAKRGVLQI